MIFFFLMQALSPLPSEVGALNMQTLRTEEKLGTDSEAQCGSFSCALLGRRPQG